MAAAAAAAAARAAVFRSLAGKMAGATPTLAHRPLLARGFQSGTGRSFHEPSGGAGAGASIGSSPPTSTEALRRAKWERTKSDFMRDAKAKFIESTKTCVTIILFGVGFSYTYVKPTLNKLWGSIYALSIENEMIKQDLQRLEAQLAEAKNIQTSGKGKDHL